MPSLVVAEQVRPELPIASPLADDIVIAVQWCVQDEHARPVASQTCALTYAVGATLTVNVPASEKRYTFHLAKGTQVAQMSLQVTVNLAAIAGNPAAVAETLSSAAIQIRSASKSEADSDASKTVYSEMNQELRRTRTLYETFLVVVTGALATVFSQRSSIAGAYRPSIAYGLGFLALIVIYMIWQIAQRYRDTTAAVFNLESSWGLRATHPTAFPLARESSWWKNHAWRHTVWAIGLTVYALLAIAVVIIYLRAPAEPPKAPPAQAVAVTCSCPIRGGAQTAPSSVTSSGRRPGGKTR